MKLYAYYRSSTSYRVRIALNLKGLAYEVVPVDLLHGANRNPDFLTLNRFGGVPALEDAGQHYVQSMAIIEWLEERFPSPPLLPHDPEQRYEARALAYAIATELHAPLNLPVLRYLKDVMGQDQAAIDVWYCHWLARTLAPLDAMVAERAVGDFLFDTPGLFETVLIPQLYNARRFACDLSLMPHLTRIEAACLAHPAFIAAHPDQQPDCPSE